MSYEVQEFHGVRRIPKRLAGQPTNPYENRGTGRTTAQMIRAPMKAIYVVQDYRGRAGYYRHLAHHLGRDDLRLESAEALDRPEKFMGLTVSAVVVDHAVQLTQRQAHALDRLMPRLVRPKAG